MNARVVLLFSFIGLYFGANSLLLLGFVPFYPSAANNVVEYTYFTAIYNGTFLAGIAWLIVRWSINKVELEWAPARWWLQIMLPYAAVITYLMSPVFDGAGMIQLYAWISLICVLGAHLFGLVLMIVDLIGGEESGYDPDRTRADARKDLAEMRGHVSCF